MKHNYFLKIAALALAAGAMPLTASAYSINFDTLTGPASASSDPVALANGVTFAGAIFTPDIDVFGDPIPGSEKWRVDGSAPTVLAQNPNLVANGGYGAAPSGVNALDARFQDTLLSFSSATNLSVFSVTLDNSVFGLPFPTDLLFLDVNKAIIGTLTLNQSTPLFFASLGAPLSGVKSILLPGNAYYDSFSIESAAPVPLPAALPLLMTALGGLVAASRRRRGTGSIAVGG